MMNTQLNVPKVGQSHPGKLKPLQVTVLLNDMLSVSTSCGMPRRENIDLEFNCHC